ncbi:hypothetical protein [Rothia nasimurium]|uniref:hypothetical protein n=1 Tax=Rothia nasimurium TaxID=85336 RepID=UPI00162351DB|nr:hypothetical protein [Rothia nasimurium]
MTKVAVADTTVNQFQRGGGKSSFRLFVSLATAEIWVFLRQPVMIALTLLLPAGLIAITALTNVSFNPQTWAQVAGRDLVATQCITVYFVALNTLTARRHTLALKRLRTTALPSIGIIAGLLVPPFLVGMFQVLAIFTGLVFLGAPLPQQPLLVGVSVLLGMVVALLAGVTTSGVTSTPEKAQWTMMPFFVAAMGATAILPSVSLDIIDLVLAVPLAANGHLATIGWYSETNSANEVMVDFSFMVIWIVILALVSWKTFRWERRR